MRLYKLLFLIAILWGVYALHHHYYFRYQLTALQLQTHLKPALPEEELSFIPENQLNNILENPFTFLGQGAQSVAFLSSDQQFVLKIIHYKYINPPPLQLVNPEGIKWRQRLPQRWQRLWQQCNSYLAIAKSRPQLGGLLHVAFKPNESKELVVTLHDRLGFVHKQNLHSTRWLLQKRVKPSEKRLEELARQGEEKRIQAFFSAVDELIETEAKLGYIDRDKGLLHNSGLDEEGSLIHFDLGCLVDLPEKEQERNKSLEEHRQAIFRKIYTWLEQRNLQAIVEKRIF